MKINQQWTVLERFEDQYHHQQRARRTNIFNRLPIERFFQSLLECANEKRETSIGGVSEVAVKLFGHLYAIFVSTDHLETRLRVTHLAEYKELTVVEWPVLHRFENFIVIAFLERAAERNHHRKLENRTIQTAALEKSFVLSSCGDSKQYPVLWSTQYGDKCDLAHACYILLFNWLIPSLTQNGDESSSLQHGITHMNIITYARVQDAMNKRENIEEQYQLE